MVIKHRPSILHIKDEIKKPFIVAEIGVYKASNILSLVEIADEIIAIDPYVCYEERVESDILGKVHKKHSQQELTDALLVARNNIFPYMDKVTHIIQKSENAARLFPDGYFDYIYIDGDHNYEAAKKDCELWFPKTKKWLAGHDFGIKEVERAVTEFVNLKRLPLKHWQTDWIIKK